MAFVNTARRGFLSGQYLIQSGRNRIADLQETWGPAPPCLSPTITHYVCINCDGPCADVCPQDIIRFYPADHTKARQAYLDFANAGCTFCQSCVDVCPASALLSTPPTALGIAKISHDQCLGWTGTMCISCRYCCPRHAIQWNRDNTPVIDLDTCTGCGSCVAICPTQALSIKFKDS